MHEQGDVNSSSEGRLKFEIQPGIGGFVEITDVENRRHCLNPIDEIVQGIVGSGVLDDEIARRIHRDTSIIGKEHVVLDVIARTHRVNTSGIACDEVTITRILDYGALRRDSDSIATVPGSDASSNGAAVVGLDSSGIGLGLTVDHLAADSNDNPDLRIVGAGALSQSRFIANIKAIGLIVRGNNAV